MSVNVRLFQTLYIVVRNYGYATAKSVEVLIKPIK